MAIPALLTEDEIKDIYEGHAGEVVAIYGWDRIVTTLVAYNVARKKLEALRDQAEKITSQNLQEH